MISIKRLTFGLVASMAMTTSTFAANINFDLKTPVSRVAALNSTYAMQYNYQQGGINLSVTGWSYRRSNSGAVVESIEQTYAGKWNGLGVERADSPDHAIDNANGDYDMLLLSFDQTVNLSALDMGWISNDSDVSMLAFNGAAPGSFVGKKWQSLLGDGWQSAGNYYNVDHSGNSGLVNPLSITSKYWLVGAYNSNLGGSFLGNNRNGSSGNDYFKLAGVTVNKVKVSEPGTLALLGLGLLGLGGLRRRAK